MEAIKEPMDILTEKVVRFVNDMSELIYGIRTLSTDRNAHEEFIKEYMDSQLEYFGRLLRHYILLEIDAMVCSKRVTAAQKVLKSYQQASANVERKGK